jgi:hypothetical protein
LPKKRGVHEAANHNGKEESRYATDIFSKEIIADLPAPATAIADF